MYEAPNRLSPAYAATCYIECRWSDGSATRASGVVVGYNDVLTALHVVYDAQLGWATEVTVIPGADTQPFLAPFGEFTNVGAISGRSGNWDFNGDRLVSVVEAEGDMALLGMTTRIGDVTGWLPVAQAPNDFYGVMAGYPARGTGQMVETVYADASSTHGVYIVPSGLGPGASGGPLLQSFLGVDSVVGVLSSGTLSNSSSTYAGLFTAASWNWLHGAMAANDSLLGDLPTAIVTPTGTIFTGSQGDDVLSGGAGWDWFTGNGGNDTFDGGVGIDTAVYSAARGAYSVTAGAGLVVGDSVPGREGVDTLWNVERLKFADVSLAFDTQGSAGKAYRLYQAAFDREPDIPGLGFQMKTLDDGWGLAAVAGNFLICPEFMSKYGGLDDRQFITQLYANVLDRAPDAGGFAYHTGNLASGANSRADVLVGFSESPENQAALIGVLQNGMTYTV